MELSPSAIKVPHAVGVGLSIKKLKTREKIKDADRNFEFSRCRYIINTYMTGFQINKLSNPRFCQLYFRIPMA